MGQQGNAAAVATDPEDDRRRDRDEQQARERIWRAAERIGERNRDREPDEVLTIVTEIVEEVRRERCERERAGA